MIDLKGKVEITGRKNGEVVYYNEGPNLVTYWARHAVMHLLTGDSFSAVGEKRAVMGHSLDTNPDGTLLSGQQFFFDNTGQRYDDNFYWNKSTSGPNNKYPFMPVKMLLGTGCEELAPAPAGVENKYSNSLDLEGTGLLSAKTKNSEDANTKTSPPITQKDFGISGAVKNGGLTSSSELLTKTTESQEGRVLNPSFSGFGEPCFIYPLRGENTHEKENAEIMLTKSSVEVDLTIEGKLTITVVLPEQTGSNSDAFYPYNGYRIKEIGLFTDAKKQICKNNTDKRMPYGMLFAKRYIPPFTKTANSSFTIRWTIYI